MFLLGLYFLMQKREFCPYIWFSEVLNYLSFSNLRTRTHAVTWACANLVLKMKWFLEIVQVSENQVGFTTLYFLYLQILCPPVLHLGAMANQFIEVL